MSAEGNAAGPDFSQGIALDKVPGEGTLAGRVGDRPVLLSRFDGKLFAVDGGCTHYGAALAKGLVIGDAVRCPWHHACFSLRTGDALRGPALDGLARWQVDVEDGSVFVRHKVKTRGGTTRRVRDEVERIVIIGGGAAGVACANALRRRGYSGVVTMLSADMDPPVDRPNLSKDYLAGSAPEEWMPLRPAEWYTANAIDLRLGCEVTRIDTQARTVRARGGEEFPFDRLLLATGSSANRLASPGFDHAKVCTLRSFADARGIINQLSAGARAAIVGASFIGMEAAAALRARGVEVEVVSPESVPFEGVFGAEVGGFLQALHERHGVRFHLRSAAGSFDGQSMSLANGARIDADLILVGIGATPRTELAAATGLSIADGVLVDEFLETPIPGIYAAGDIASYPDPLTGERTRIEHWVTAQRQGQTVAANMLGLKRRYRAVPFFWTEQFGVALRYVGQGRGFDEVRIDGEIERGDFIARYFAQGVHRASAAVGRDLEILEDERRLEDAASARTAGAHSDLLTPSCLA